MAVIIVYGGNFGRNSCYRNEFPVALLWKVILSEFGRVCPVVYGGNFGRNSRYRNEFPVALRRTVILSEFRSICPVNIGITQDSLSVRTLCCPDLWLSDSSALTFLFSIGLLFIN